MTLKAPFPYFGGKSAVAHLVWQRFGPVKNYVEPFFGSGAVLLGRPHKPGIETVNDLDGFIANFWRALSIDPEGVAAAADWPVSEVDLHARHAWLVAQRADLTERLMGDPGFFDSKIAGWWVWGLCSWIGSGWCSGKGAWTSEDGRLVNAGNAGLGINRQRPHLGDAGRGINSQRLHLGVAGQGILDEMRRLMVRLRRVRVCCGDWQRVCGPSVTTKRGVAGVMLDPPYGQAGAGRAECYALDDFSAAAAVQEWCAEAGASPLMRIALCGYEGEHEALEGLGWSAVAWKARGGMGSQGDARGRDNASRERIWFSPHCLGTKQMVLI